MVLTPRSLQNYIMPYAMTALLDETMLKVLGTLKMLDAFHSFVCFV